jgi:hypothetical protein
MPVNEHSEDHLRIRVQFWNWVHYTGASVNDARFHGKDISTVLHCTVAYACSGDAQDKHRTAQRHHDE